jgi:hypothetical protein
VEVTFSVALGKVFRQRDPHEWRCRCGLSLMWVVEKKWGGDWPRPQKALALKARGLRVCM